MAPALSSDAAAGCERVLLEGGSYQNLLVAALHAAQLPVVIVNQRPVREFARSIGQLAKTDQSADAAWDALNPDGGVEA